MTEIVKLENNLCRCCHSEGSYKSLAEPCTGSCLYKPEIFADMLKNYLDITLSPVAGELCVPTYTICDLCIMKLCNAVTFKKQVLQCEEKFIMLYTSNIMKVEDPKIPEVKVELTEIDEEKNEESSVCDDTRPDDLSACDDRIQDEDFPSIDDDAEFQLQCDLAAIQANEEKKAQSRTRRNQEAEKPTKNKKKPAKKGRPVKKKEPVTEVLSDGEETKKQEIEKQKKMLEEEKKKGNSVTRRPIFKIPETDYEKDGDGYICTKCDKKSRCWASLKDHLKRLHYKIPRYVCSVCKETFNTLPLFNTHKLEKHNVDDRFQCNACGRTFHRRARFVDHLSNFHMLGEKIKCDLCEFETFSRKRLNLHKMNHRTVRDFQCRFCHKAFKRKNTMQCHERIHTGDKRKVCQVCKKAFVQKASLNYHMTKYHPEVNF